MVSYALNDLPSPSDNRYPGKRDSILFASVSPIPSTGSGAQKVLNKHLQNESAFCYELIHRRDSGKYSTEGRHSWMVWGRPGDGRALGGGPGARLWSVMRTSRALGAPRQWECGFAPMRLALPALHLAQGMLHKYLWDQVCARPTFFWS